MTAYVRYRKRRRADGLCAYHGCLEKTGDAYRCAVHAAAHSARVMASYWRKQERKARERAA